MENAKVYAENVIRNRKEAIGLRRFGVKMGALSSKLESAYRTQEVSNQIKDSLPMLKKCMKDMDSIGVSYFLSLTRIKVSGSIGDFERVFEDLDVKVEEMNGALDGVYSSSIDNGEVNDLLAELGS